MLLNNIEYSIHFGTSGRLSYLSDLTESITAVKLKETI